MSATWTCTHDVPVGKECFCLLIVILFRSFFCELTLVIQRQKDLLRGFVVNGLACAMIHVEGHAQGVKAIPHLCMILVDNCLRRGVFLQGLVRYSSPMF